MFKSLIYGWAALCVLLLAPWATWCATADDDIPVAPISAVEFRGWTNAYRLRNEVAEMVIVPEIGRLVHWGYVGETNLFRLDSALSKDAADVDEPGIWNNFGGDWIWPVAQSHWPLFQDGDWPPSRLLDGRPWTGRAWRSADGSQYALMTQTYGEPLHIKVTRTIRLDRTNAMASIRQRIERTGPSDIPVTLWNISQIRDAEWVVIPVDEDSAFFGGFKSMKFEEPGPEHIQWCGDTIVYDAQLGGEHKICSDSERHWIAAMRGGTVLFERVKERNAVGAGYPDGGCRIEMYAHRGLGYAEIETLSEERVLEPGETLENALVMRLFRVSPDLDSCALSDAIQIRIGEMEKPKPEPEEEEEEEEEDREDGVAQLRQERR